MNASQGATFSTTLDLYRRQRHEVAVTTAPKAMPMIRLTMPGGPSVSLRLDELQAATRFAWKVLDGGVEPDPTDG